MQNKEKIILDCDPGHDDAVAIMLASASPKIELLGITVSSGNQTVEKTGHNALCLAEFLNISCPVCLGSPRPIEKEPMICPQIHGESGLDGVTLENKTKQFDKRDATT